MTVQILIGDVREKLRELADESVHCVVTSPPYWGLRDYGTAAWSGGDLGCDHIQSPQSSLRPDRSRATSGTFHGSMTTDNSIVAGKPYGKVCAKCGGRRIDSQLGLEPTYQEHVSTMADVFDEVKRVLRKDGTLWLNYGDSYNANQGKGFDTNQDGGDRKAAAASPKLSRSGLKPKDLCGIPWRMAFALQERGWYLRQDIIWSKPNPMPESVTDRCTKAHEYVFLLTKSPRYYCDMEAVREDIKPNSGENMRAPKYDGGVGDRIANGARDQNSKAYDEIKGANRRSVWQIATAPYPEAHFATFPPELAETCIKAGTSEKGCCGKCGKPWVRETIDEPDQRVPYATVGVGAKQSQNHGRNDLRKVLREDGRGGDLASKRCTTLGWSASCDCGSWIGDKFHKGAPLSPCTVLDPFSGAGTTGLVADRLQRNAILIELNPTYAALAEKRIRNDAGMFGQVAAE